MQGAGQLPWWALSSVSVWKPSSCALVLVGSLSAQSSLFWKGVPQTPGDFQKPSHRQVERRPRPAGSAQLLSVPGSLLLVPCDSFNPLGPWLCPVSQSFSFIASPYSRMLFCLLACRKWGQGPFACWSSSYKIMHPLCIFNHNSVLEEKKELTQIFWDRGSAYSILRLHCVAVQICRHHLQYSSHSSQETDYTPDKASPCGYILLVTLELTLNLSSLHLILRMFCHLNVDLCVCKNPVSSQGRFILLLHTILSVHPWSL